MFLQFALSTRSVGTFAAQNVEWVDMWLNVDLVATVTLATAPLAARMPLGSQVYIFGEIVHRCLERLSSC